MARGRFHRIAILWLRLVAAIMILYAVMDLLLAAFELKSADEMTRQAVHGAFWYGAGGLVLWLLSPAIGKLVAAGLDDPPIDPPAV